MESKPTSEGRAGKAWTVLLAWIGGITAVLGFLGTVSGTFSKISDYLHHDRDLDAKITLAQAQVKQEEYPQALETYAAILKADPHYRPAQQAQLLTVEQWVRNFHVTEREGEKSTVTAATLLDQVFPILDAARINAKGPQAADIQAHLGWAHWLNYHIALRETPSVAEDDLKAALAIDPNNVFANAMLGNGIIQIHGSLPDALKYLQTAVATGNERPFVRRFQLGALTFDEEPGARAAIMKAANEMRLGNEPLADERKLNILSFCCSTSNFHTELTESLTAVSPADTLETYKWLDQYPASDPSVQRLKRRYIEASLLEARGQREAALAQFRVLNTDVQGHFTNLDEAVPEAIKRLSHK